MCRDYSMCFRDRQLGLDAISTPPCLETVNRELSQTEPQLPHLRTGSQGHQPIAYAMEVRGGV